MKACDSGSARNPGKVGAVVAERSSCIGSAVLAGSSADATVPYCQGKLLKIFTNSLECGPGIHPRIGYLHPLDISSTGVCRGAQRTRRQRFRSMVSASVVSARPTQHLILAFHLRVGSLASSCPQASSHVSRPRQLSTVSQKIDFAGFGMLRKREAALRGLPTSTARLLSTERCTL